MYKETTRSITITVVPTYLDDQSSPEESHYVWKYHVRIENNGEDTVQLRTRYWRITDAVGRVQEVRGPGVVGKQPVLVAILPIESVEPCTSMPRSSSRPWAQLFISRSTPSVWSVSRFPEISASKSAAAWRDKPSCSRSARISRAA